MKIKKIIIVALTFFSFISIKAQQSIVHTSETFDFDRAVFLYKEKQYLSAQILFEQIKQNTTNAEIESDCAYYIANCAVQTEQNGADLLLENFIENYPTSTKRNDAFINTGDYYFNQADYENCLTWLEKVDQNNLSKEDKDKYNFQKGYAYFQSDDKRQAEKHLQAVSDSYKYGDQAKYYLGHLAYQGDDYKQASEYFDQVATQEQYKDKLSYFQADMNFKLGNFQKAIGEGTSQLDKSNAQEKSELNKIIGESYFNLGKYQEAIPYLKQYKGKNGKWNNTDFYQLGYAYYKQKDYQNAISQFNKIIDGQDFVAQNAYYHLGESYLKTDQKTQALNAFKNALEMHFDKKIQEDAYLNYAKLSYEIGNNYQSIPGILTDFIEKYPNNPNRQEIENLLVNSYITSKNYKEALVLLNKNKNHSNKQAYQKVTFYRGLELYTDGNYQEALGFFQQSIDEPIDEKFVARAIFWKAETEYVLNDFQESLLSFKQFESNAQAKNTPEFKNLNYNLGYAYFKLKNYEQSIIYFQKFIDSKPENTRLNDAYLRLADSYFVSGKYWPAMESYNKVIANKGTDLDYALFQKAISYGFVDRPQRKIEDLSDFIAKFPKSQYHADAMFEVANAYANSNKNQDNSKALELYENLIKTHPKSSYVPKAILRQGLIYYNANKDDLALTKLKKVASDFPNSHEAIEAVSVVKNIYIDQGKVDQYAVWTKTLDYIEVSDVELDNATFESAEKQYLQNNKKGAINGFTGYLSQFPKGLHHLKSEFYLAEMYFSDNLSNLAEPYYQKVIERSRNEFTEQSLVRLSEIHLKKEDFSKAIVFLKRLESESEFPQNRTYAQANLMRSYYNTEDYQNTVIYAEKVLANNKTDNKVKSDAQIMIARSAIKTNNETKAKKAYKDLESIAGGELKAEALYYDAYFKNKENKFEESNKVIQTLTKDYSGYKYFGVKGLVVMAKNFYALNDSFQATHILESVIKNFPEFSDVIAQAKTELEKIKSEEAKHNESIKE